MPTLLLTILLAGCQRDAAPATTTAPPAVQLAEIFVTPDEVTVESGPGNPGQVLFEARGVTTDGAEVALDLVSWELSNPTAGTIDAEGKFRPSTTNGGITWLTATLAGVSGQATITVRYVDEITHPDVDPAWFGATPQPWSGAWLYPEDGVALPRNTPSIHWQWADPTTLPYSPPGPPLGHRVVFQSPLTEITWYTPDRELVLDNDTWATIASTNAGGAVEVGLETALADRVLVEEPIEVRVQRMDAEGSVIYWSTTASGLVEIPFGDQARDFLTASQTGRCVGCHAISKDNLVSFTWDGGDGALGVFDMSTGGQLASAGGGNFSTFSPDGSMLLVASFGNLILSDPWTGTQLATVQGSANATHPDWAPDDSAVVFTQSDGHVSDWTIEGTTRIAVMDHLGNGSFGAPRVIYEAPPGMKAYYPAWSPDSQWIAFNVSAGDCYDDPDAELWVMYRTGEFGAVRLDRANLGPGLTNSWPRWAPLPDDDVLWLAFASRRNYGFQTTDTPQIWVTALDPAALAAGQDPSFPAFWLPGQPPSTGNHIPVWVE